MDVVFAPAKVLTNTLQFAFIFLYISHLLRCFTILPPRRNFSLVARYSMKFTRCSLLVVKSLVTCCKIRSLLVAEVVRCKKSLVICCKICLLLVAEVARCKKSLVTRSKIRSLLVAEVARCKTHSLLVAKFARYSLQKLLVAKTHLLLLAKFARCFLQKWSHFL